MFGIPKIYKGTSVLKNYTEEKSDINETLPYEYVAIQEKFFTKEKYREDGKMKRYYVSFTSGSTEINKQEDIDKIATSELADKFSYYWYPSADDLLIISPSFEWIIGIRHDGALFFILTQR